MAKPEPPNKLASCPAPWLDERRGYLVDWLTQIWVRVTGRAVSIQQEPWIDVPLGETRGIGEAYLAALARLRGFDLVRRSKSGLVERFSGLRGKRFNPSIVHPDIARFYEQTWQYELNLESTWCGLWRPFGWLIAFTFSRRLQQLNLPVCRYESDEEVTNEIVQYRDSGGETRLTGWFRTLSRTRQAIYVGFYSQYSPSEGDPMVRVAFPIPNGCALVLMEPKNHGDGSFQLVSDGSRFGGPGFYFLLRRDAQTSWVRRVRSLRESILVRASGDGQLSAIHDISIWRTRALRMSYRIVPRRSLP